MHYKIIDEKKNPHAKRKSYYFYIHLQSVQNPQEISRTALPGSGARGLEVTLRLSHCESVAHPCRGRPARLRRPPPASPETRTTPWTAPADVRGASRSAALTATLAATPRYLRKLRKLLHPRHPCGHPHDLRDPSVTLATPLVTPRIRVDGCIVAAVGDDSTIRCCTVLLCCRVYAVLCPSPARTDQGGEEVL